MATLTETWEPANHLEEQLRDALRTGDQDAYFAALRVSELFVPVTQPEPGNPQAAFTWPTATREDRTHVLAYTSPEAARLCLGPGYEQLARMPLTEIARNWPNIEWWLAIDSGLPIEGYLPAWFIGKLTTDAPPQPDGAPAHDGTTARPGDPRHAGSPAAPPAPAHGAAPFHEAAPPAHGPGPHDGFAASGGAPRHDGLPPGERAPFPPGDAGLPQDERGPFSPGDGVPFPRGERGPQGPGRPVAPGDAAPFPNGAGGAFPPGEVPAAHEGGSFRSPAGAPPFPPPGENPSIPPGEPHAFTPHGGAAPRPGEAGPYPPGENPSIPPGELPAFPPQGEPPAPHGDPTAFPPRGEAGPFPRHGEPPAPHGEGASFRPPAGAPPFPARDGNAPVPPGEPRAFPPHGDAGPGQAGPYPHDPNASIPPGEPPAFPPRGDTGPGQAVPYSQDQNASIPPGELPAFPPRGDTGPGQAVPYSQDQNASIPPGELPAFPPQGEPPAPHGGPTAFPPRGEAGPLPAQGEQRAPYGVPGPHGEAAAFPPAGEAGAFSPAGRPPALPGQEEPPPPHGDARPVPPQPDGRASYGAGQAPPGERPARRRGRRHRTPPADGPVPGDAPPFPPHGEAPSPHGDPRPDGVPSLPPQHGESAAYDGRPAPYGEPPAPRPGDVPPPYDDRGPGPASALLNGAVPPAPAGAVPSVAETRPQPAVSEFDPVPPVPAARPAAAPGGDGAPEGTPAPPDVPPAGDAAHPDTAAPPVPGDGVPHAEPAVPDAVAPQGGPAPDAPSVSGAAGPAAPETEAPAAAAVPGAGRPPAEPAAVPPSGLAADPPITLHHTPGADFTPLDDEERALYDAAGRGDGLAFLRILATAQQIWVPMVEGADLMLGPGRPGFRWYTREEDGRTVVPLFTGPSRMREAMGGHPFVLSDPAKVLRFWPDPSWDLVVNAGSPIGGTIPGARITELSRYVDAEAAAILARDFPAQNDAERRLFDARGDVDLMVKTLLEASVFLPVWSRTPPTAQIAPGDPAFPWSAVPVRGRMAVAVFTSFDWMKEAVGTTGFVMPSFAELLAAWPQPDWSVSVNAGTPIEVTLSGEEIRALGGAVAEHTTGALAGPAGVIAPPSEPVPVEDARPVPEDAPGTGEETPAVAAEAPAEPAEAVQAGAAPDPAADEPAEGAARIWTIMQKVVPHDQVPWYRDKAYDRVGGFVHRVRDVIELATPKQLYEALGLVRHGSPFHPDDAEVYVIRWPAYLPELYRVPFGGNDEDALATWGDDGWVVEAPPFQGDGFAPGSGGTIPEYKLDSMRLPHGAEMYVINADGTERFVARYDADRLAWGDAK